MRPVVCLAILSLALSNGCARVAQTKDNHYVHKGEAALLTHAWRTSLPVAVAKTDAFRVDQATEGHDKAAVQMMITNGKAIEIRTGTRVFVTGESSNERKIRIDEGPYSGESGWVPFEWLKPAPSETSPPSPVAAGSR